VRVRKRWRAWLRAIHRDVGYLAVGLTFVYALSGIAINHIEDWNPNFVTGQRTHHLEGPLPKGEAEATREVLRQLDIDATPSIDDFYMASDTELEITLNRRTLLVNTAALTVVDRYEKPRFFLRVANWLHYNRGKAAWTYIADGYAAFLLFLAVSGAFMLKGRRGLIGRGGVLIAMGIAVPVVYVTMSGGP
jgi:hypothetical protein